MGAMHIWRFPKRISRYRLWRGHWRGALVASIRRSNNSESTSGEEFHRPWSPLSRMAGCCSAGSAPERRYIVAPVLGESA